MKALLLSVLLCLNLFVDVLAQESLFELKQVVGVPIRSPREVTVDNNGNIYVLDYSGIIKFDQQGKQDRSYKPEIENWSNYNAISIAVGPSNNLYVLNHQTGETEKFSPEGKLLLKFGVEVHTPPFHYPTSLLVDTHENIYVTDKTNRELYKYDASGEFLSRIVLSGFCYGESPEPTDFAIDAEGYIYTISQCSAYIERVFKFSQTGRLLDRYGDFRSNGLGFINSPSSIIVDAESNIYVSDTYHDKVFVINKAGQLIREIGKAAGLHGIDISLALDNKGFLYITDFQYSFQRTSRILKFNRSGELVTQWGDVYNTKKVVIDLEDNVFVIGKNSEITKFDKHGTVVSTFGQDVNADSKSYLSSGIAVDGQGNIYELTRTNNQPIIFKYDATGRLINIFNNLGIPHCSYSECLVDIDVDQAGNIYLADYFAGVVRKLNSFGRLQSTIGQKGIGAGQITFPKGVSVDVMGNIYVLDNSSGAGGPRVHKFNAYGENVLEIKLTKSNEYGWSAVSIDVDGKGNIYVINVNSSYELIVYDKFGNLVDRNKLDDPFGYPSSLGINMQGSLLAIGGYRSDAYTLHKSVTYTEPLYFISGTVYNDNNSSCTLDEGNRGLAGIVMEAEPGPYYAVTKGNGEYTIAIEPGSYVVRPIINPLAGRSIIPSCQEEELVTLTGNSSHVVNVNFGNRVVETPMLSVNISSDRRRRCFESTTSVSYSNTGFAPATGAKVHVQLPEYIGLSTASVPYTRTADGTYVFDVGTLAPGQHGKISIQDSVICGNEEIRGLTVCTKAWITPSVKPLPFLSGSCDAQKGSVRFVLRNPTQTAMAVAKEYRLFVDGRPSIVDYYQLSAGDSLVLAIPATGQTMRLEADLADGTKASATVEACRSSQLFAFSTGFVNAMPPYDPDPAPAFAVDCLPIIDSYDPNDKQVVPTGLTDQRYTPTGAALRYKIRFQNTGTDVAYRVVVVDTLSPYLDISTLKVGAVSHNYRFEVSGKGQPVLTWTFNNIMLPDSNTNEPASHGFIDFSIKPKADLPEKTAIENWADIYFDFNSPVRTDTTLNRIYDMPLVIQEEDRILAEQVVVSPTITGFLPVAGKFNDEVLISGTKFSATPLTNKVYVNGVLAQVIGGDTTTLTIKVPMGATSGPIKVLTEQAGATTSATFTVYQPPVIGSFSPSEGVVSTEVTLQGDHLSPELLDSIYLGTLKCRLLTSTQHSVTIEIPAQASTGHFAIYTKGGSTQSSAAFKVWHTPIISGTDVPMQRVGGRLVITGKHFSADAARNVVRFGAIQAAILQAGEGQLLVQVPVGAQTGMLQVTTPGGVVTTPFEIIPAPVLTEVYPSKASVGSVVELRGSHFKALSQTDTVTFAGVEATVLTATATTMQVRVPRGAQTGNVTIAGAGGQAEKAFEVQQLSPQEAIQIYPNPTPGNLILDFMKADFDVHAIEILDVVGRRVYAGSLQARVLNQAEVNLSEKKPGVYMVLIYTSQGKVVKKITVM